MIKGVTAEGVIVTVRYDLHLSAMRITQASIRKLEGMGFRRDEFANNTRCLAAEYHATFRGARPLPDDVFWEDITDVLLADREFHGCLEEESMAPEYSCRLGGEASVMPEGLPQVCLTDVPPGKHKACDLHIGVNLTASTSAAVEQLERLQVASFDKHAPGGIRRVYSITCETPEDGKRLFQALAQHLTQVPGLLGKMKLEMTTRYLRIPADAPTLPLTTSEAVAVWLDRAGLRAPRSSGTG